MNSTVPSWRLCVNTDKSVYLSKHIFSLMMRLTCCVRHSCCSLIYMMKETLYHRSQSLEVSKIKGKKLEKLWSSIINNFLIF